MPGSAVLGSSGAILGTIILGEVSTTSIPIISHIDTISDTLILSDSYIIPNPDPGVLLDIILQGYNSDFAITEGYDIYGDVIITPPKIVLTSILRIIDSFIVVSKGQGNIIKDELFLDDEFIVQGSFQRMWIDRLIIQDPFASRLVDNHYITFPTWIVFKTHKSGAPIVIHTPSGDIIKDNFTANNLPNTRYYITLYSIYGSINLPNPLFGDTQESVNEVFINKTVGGRRYSYVKTSRRKKLEYKFELRYAKMVELQTFLDLSNLEWIILINFKEEQWSVKLTNNPVVYTGISNGWYEVNLEFEGYRIIQGQYFCLE